jgi:hypothetical protein
MSDKPLICAVRLPDDVWAALSLEGGIYVCPDGADLGAGVEWDGYTDPQRALMCWPRARWA